MRDIPPFRSARSEPPRPTQAAVRADVSIFRYPMCASEQPQGPFRKSERISVALVRDPIEDFVDGQWRRPRPPAGPPPSASSGLPVNFVRTKCDLVLSKAEVPQPLPDIHGRTLTCSGDDGLTEPTCPWHGSHRLLWVDCVEKVDFRRRSHCSRPSTAFKRIERPVRPGLRHFSVRSPQSIYGAAKQRKRHSTSKGAISADVKFSTFSTQSTQRRRSLGGALC